MNDHEIRDRCCWKHCRQDSGIIFMGAGLCDEHWALACSVFKPTYEYALPRVVPAAARAMREQNEINLHQREALHGQTESV